MWLVFLDKGRLSALGEAGRLLKNSPPPKPKAISLDRTEVFATVLFTEFLKELAAIAQEHSILSYIPMEEWLCPTRRWVQFNLKTLKHFSKIVCFFQAQLEKETS